MKAQDSKQKTDIAPTAKPNDLMSLDDFDQLFDEFLTRRWPRFFEWNFPRMQVLEKGSPKVNIIDHDNTLEVQAALPGVKKEDLDVSISNQSLTIRTCTQKQQEETGKYFQREISRDEYQRTLTLPNQVDAANAEATFKDGILKILLPKIENAKITKIGID